MNFDHNWIKRDEDDEIFGFSYFSPSGPSYASRWPKEVLVPTGLKNTLKFQVLPPNLSWPKTTSGLPPWSGRGRWRQPPPSPSEPQRDREAEEGQDEHLHQRAQLHDPHLQGEQEKWELLVTTSLPGDVSQDGQAHSSSTGSATPEGDPRQLGQLHWGQLQASHADGQGVEAADHPLCWWLPLRRRLGQGEDFICVRVGQSDSQLFSSGIFFVEHETSSTFSITPLLFRTWLVRAYLTSSIRRTSQRYH